MNLVYVLSCCVGLTFILKYGSILQWLRVPLSRLPVFDKLFKCSLCLGFWSGAVIASALYFIDWNKQFFLLPLASAAFSWVFDGLMGMIQSKVVLMERRLSTAHVPCGDSRPKNPE